MFHFTSKFAFCLFDLTMQQRAHGRIGEFGVYRICTVSNFSYYERFSLWFIYTIRIEIITDHRLVIMSM